MRLARPEDIRVRIVGTHWCDGFWHLWAVLGWEGMSPEVSGHEAFEVEVALQLIGHGPMQ